MVLFILIGIVVVFMVPQLNVGEVFKGAMSKQNRGIVLNYFYMSPKRAVEILGEPHSTAPYRDNEELQYWKYDPVTVELHFREKRVARIAYATSNELIRDHIEDRSLTVYGREEDWRQHRRNIDGEWKVVYENIPAEMTVVKYKKSVMIYNYIFPDKNALVSE